ncbi:predicted protein [Naegleria gruberi]|uniref:dolichyl-phosphate beta-glucosyltransferase n=1 Tax=Naegleria gruberi TaxID=5762 RepID=D2VFI5_NAEGR|nr:uncharacterized protein NAEGRDRAFT_33611 [Naegleria gruberi]EFC44470.1 predicted protein [Naegleria gruberi]|eukprot:XP_002677214.1 predicted protein [Naegleria gruberi strain NEG-M]
MTVTNPIFLKRHETQAEQYSVLNESDLDLSIVFPAYKEETRINVTLKDTYQYLEGKIEKNPNFKCEMIIVDDGSTDNTIGVTVDFMKEYINRNNNIDIQLLRLIKNKGKGFAVKQGMIRSRGKLILFADSDNATDIRDLDKLLTKMEEMKQQGKSKYGYMVVGSRNHLLEGVKRERKWYRNITMYGFHFLVNFVANIRNVADTQCGFKLMDRESVRQVLPNMKIDRWCFDIDLIHICNSLNIPIHEHAVNWSEIEGSKVNISGIIGMARDLFLVRMFYTLGIWKVQTNPKLETTL